MSPVPTEVAPTADPSSAHPVAKKLEASILPWLLSARHLGQQPLYLVHTAHRYGSDLMAAVAGLGFSSPIFGLLGGSSPTSVAAGASSLPLIGAAAVVLWASIKVFLTIEDGERRAAHGKGCVSALKKCRVAALRALEKPDPMLDLSTIQLEIEKVVDGAIQERSWLFDVLAPGIEREVEIELGSLCRRYGRNWAPAPPLEVRRDATA